MRMENDLIMGRKWEQINRAQQGDSSALNRRVDTSKAGDYGCDPLGNGMFKMVPSGDVVNSEERANRLA